MPHCFSVSTVVYDTQLFFPITHFLTQLLSIWVRLLLKLRLLSDESGEVVPRSTIDGSRAFQTVQAAPKPVYAALLIRIGAVGNKIWITQLHPLLRLALFWGVYPGPCGPCTFPSWLLPHRGSVSTVVFDTQLFFPITHFLTQLLSIWVRLLSGQPQKLFRQLF